MGRDAKFEDVSNKVMYKKICAESTKTIVITITIPMVTQKKKCKQK